MTRQGDRTAGRITAVWLAIAFFSSDGGATAGAPGPPLPKAHPSLERELEAADPGERIKAWVRFRPDKGVTGVDGNGF